MPVIKIKDSQIFLGGGGGNYYRTILSMLKNILFNNNLSD